MLRRTQKCQITFPIQISGSPAWLGRATTDVVLLGDGVECELVGIPIRVTAFAGPPIVFEVGLADGSAASFPPDPTRQNPAQPSARRSYSSCLCRNTSTRGHPHTDSRAIVVVIVSAATR